jgi:hypothetical protein
MKDITLEQLEGGSFLVRWKSMEDKEPGCAYYQIIAEGVFKGENHIIDFGRVKAEGKKEYAHIISRQLMNFDTFVVHVKALKPRNVATKT